MGRPAKPNTDRTQRARVALAAALGLALLCHLLRGGFRWKEMSIFIKLRLLTM